VCLFVDAGVRVRFVEAVPVAGPAGKIAETRGAIAVVGPGVEVG
jgi:hypothetical protein